ncbi:C_GCAxxG_C_C family protein [candidate division KSB1 bacterium]|nr:C_GCAxxG_C_C family protein [candidate division KSB1 bacterium]
MTRPEKAVELFNSGFACSQAVLAAYAPMLGLSEDLALKIACPFGGGIARSGATCGAVSGAIMTIGLHSGNTRADQPELRSQNTALARRFLDEFISHHANCVSWFA